MIQKEQVRNKCSQEDAYATSMFYAALMRMKTLTILPYSAPSILLLRFVGKRKAGQYIKSSLA